MADTPDETENVQPNYCRECGRDLYGIEGLEEYSEECVGFRIIPVVRRYMKKTCPCGCCNSMKPVKRRNPVYLAR